MRKIHDKKMKKKSERNVSLRSVIAVTVVIRNYTTFDIQMVISSDLPMASALKVLST